MARLSKLHEIQFPVTLAPLHARLGAREIPVSEGRAVVDTRSGRVLGVVGREYRLVTHAQALDWAFACAREAFPETHPADWQVAEVDAPATGSCCFIDLRLRTSTLDFRGLPGDSRPEVYGPFVRVVNSYNRSRALGFDIGYLRKACSNGLVVHDALIRFRMNHHKRDIGETVHFDISQERLAAHRTAFQAFLVKLQGCPVPAPAFCGLACAALGFAPPRCLDHARDAVRQAQWRRLLAEVEAAGQRYATELGENAYAVLNTVTELASRPPDNPLVHRDRHGLQRLAGQWVGEFAAVCGDAAFDVGAYLRSLATKATAEEAASVK